MDQAAAGPSLPGVTFPLGSSLFPILFPLHFIDFSLEHSLNKSHAPKALKHPCHILRNKKLKLTYDDPNLVCPQSSSPFCSFHPVWTEWAAYRSGAETPNAHRDGQISSLSSSPGPLGSSKSPVASPTLSHHPCRAVINQSRNGRVTGTQNEISQKPQSCSVQESRGLGWRWGRGGGSSSLLVHPGLETGGPGAPLPPVEPLPRDQLSRVFQEERGRWQSPGPRS